MTDKTYLKDGEWITRKTYLGDGLYAEFDGFMLALSANVPTTDTVYLEPEVWEALKTWMEKIEAE